MLTQIELFRILNSASKTETYLGPLNETAARFDISTPLRMGAFLAQVIHESGNFSRFRENLNYGAAGLLATFPKYFDAVTAKAYERQPEKIANRVYANRMGNGPEESGDGWKYRGVGLIQLTGRDNLRSCSLGLYQDERLCEDPGILESAEDSCLSAGWFWNTNKLNQLADQEDTKGITRKINGGYNGLKERQDNYDRIMRVFGGG